MPCLFASLSIMLMHYLTLADTTATALPGAIDRRLRGPAAAAPRYVAELKSMCCLYVCCVCAVLCCLFCVCAVCVVLCCVSVCVCVCVAVYAVCAVSVCYETACRRVQDRVAHLFSSAASHRRCPMARAMLMARSSGRSSPVASLVADLLALETNDNDDACTHVSLVRLIVVCL